MRFVLTVRMLLTVEQSSVEMHAGVGIAIRAIGQAPQAATFNTILPR
jgi:hypothetical protein